MSRFFKRLLFALITLGLGALAYALVRAESAAEPSPAEHRDPGKAGAPKPSGPAVRADARPAAPVAERESPGAEPRVCAGKTKSGKRCSRPAQAGSRYCWQHGG